MLKSKRSEALTVYTPPQPCIGRRIYWGSCYLSCSYMGAAIRNSNNKKNELTEWGKTLYDYIQLKGSMDSASLQM
jgi:hypothetical protein